MLEPGRFIRTKDNQEVWVLRVEGDTATIRYQQKRGFRYTVRPVSVENFLARHRKVE